jgi:UDP-glucose:(heptosyl)LPS alpha-1,3-glucosyltransferase
MRYQHFNTPTFQHSASPPPLHLHHLQHSNTPTLQHSILHSAWSYPTLPKAWQAHAADSNTHFWVASDHIQRGFIEDGVHEDRIAVVSPGFNEGVFHPAMDPWLDLDQHTRASFKFLFMGNTHPRHGLDLLVDAYARGFTREDDVCLVIKEVLRPGEPRNEACLNKIRTVLQDFDAPEILHMRITLTEDGLAGLYTACDALVYPCQATDFPLAALEAMACACPVIVPEDGACAALSPPSRTGDDLVYWIKTSGETPAATDTPTVRPARDILPSVESLEQQMRYVMENRDEARARAQLGCEYVRGRFTWEKIVNKLALVKA